MEHTIAPSSALLAGATSAAIASMARLTEAFASKVESPMVIGGGGINFFFNRTVPSGKATHRCWAQISGEGRLLQVSEVRAGGKREFYTPGSPMFRYFQLRATAETEHMQQG